ncbi:hypothetical protein [Phytomonospora endophytica]|uniref:Uncharacterized protein n=1 Tax=Phytomonospora endophytica TaxID=714109 RepID=A0A841FQQ6_9ACTN|nr:hypothetical protein [Phytomonospora endophytica]MBB6035892.1 hypothetical protein [Phytomonospora endophytica]GIG71112.1 hypothetical protein Pen01_74070 [Phytomonospora endophytica]
MEITLVETFRVSQRLMFCEISTDEGRPGRTAPGEPRGRGGRARPGDPVDRGRSGPGVGVEIDGAAAADPLYDVSPV